MLTRKHGWGRLGGRRRSMERYEHPAEALKRRHWQSTLSAPTETPLQVVLAHRQDRGHYQVPDAGDNKQLQDSIRGGRDLLLPSEELSDRGGEGQRTGLQHRDRL